MAANNVQLLPEGDQWLYEVKLDGYRALILKSGEKVRIRSRNDKDLTSAHPCIVAAASRLRAESAILDGEIVAVEEALPPSRCRRCSGSS